VPRVAALAALIGLVAVLPSAAHSGSGKIAFRGSAGIYTVDADGNGSTLLRAGTSLTQPRWSPDGTVLAFTALSGDPDQVRLLVMDSDGSDEHLVATGRIALSHQPWSPDGARISWGPSSAEGDIYTASTAGGDVRRLTGDGRRKSPPVWSPTGQTLVYSGFSSDRWELFRVGAEGSEPTPITYSAPGVTNNQPTWVPTGESLAFFRDDVGDEPAIYVIRPDGTDLHRLAEVYGINAGEPAWTPDGTRIAFTTSVNTGYARYGAPGREVFAIDVDGTHEQRLTELAPRLVADTDPIWSPDGDRILFTRDGNLATMNADGTCENVLKVESSFSSPSWQPLPGGPEIGPKRCHALAVSVSVLTNPFSYSALITASITNEGTEQLTSVSLVASTRNDVSLYSAPIQRRLNACSIYRGRVSCRVPTLEPGGSVTVEMRADARRVGIDQRSADKAHRTTVTVGAAEALLPTTRESAEVKYTIGRCSTRGLGGGRIDGTRFYDRICGRRGRDRIHPLEGKDVVLAGSGNDVVFAEDGNLDSISCGKGRDVVVADQKDRVAPDCERVRRR
jgi:Tol biopolymer transport system component